MIRDFENERRYTKIDVVAVRSKLDDLMAKGHTRPKALRMLAIQSCCHHKTLSKLLTDDKGDM